MNWICTYYYCTSIERLSHYNVCCPVYNTKLVKITNTAFTEESVCKEIHMSSTTLDGNGNAQQHSVSTLHSNNKKRAI
jgi:hypothetical protein